MNVLDLFSGIGGFSLGLERAGMRTVAFCEIDPFCRRVLAKHWPSVPCFPDITKLRGADVGSVDVICGGFPCQDISVAGKGAGLAGERSGLWSEYARIVGELRPRFVIVENVSALLARGIDRVLGDLAALGYDAEWHCIPASAVGAPHRRDRLWIIAYADSVRELQSERLKQDQRRWPDNEPSEVISNPDRSRFQKRQLLSRISPEEGRNDNGQDASVGSWWTVEPNLVRVVHGIPGRVDRIRSLGNAVVPQIPEIIGRAIMNVSPLPLQDRGQS
jgi:DNA (cytosine-5)-methyltransferase 1